MSPWDENWCLGVSVGWGGAYCFESTMSTPTGIFWEAQSCNTVEVGGSECGCF